MVLFFFVLITAVSINTTNVSAAYSSSFTSIWSCGSGFPAGGCFKEGCMTEKQLNMENNQYTLKFNAPKAAAYKCTITAVTNDFGFKCGWPPYKASAAEPNEKTQVSLNSKILGTTDDTYCNDISECVHPPCINNVPGDVGGLNNPTCFSGMTDTKFCKKGSVQFTISNIDANELATVKDHGINNTDDRWVIFDMSNTENRNFFIARYMWYNDQKRYVLVSSLYNCHECHCCYCIESPGGTPDGGWCGAGFFRTQSPTLDESGGTYEVTWDGDAAKLCIRKVGGDFICDTAAVKVPFELNSYCAGSGCADNSRWHSVPTQHFTSATVTVHDFKCDATRDAASQSCTGSSNGAGGGGSCGGGGGAYCGNNIAEGGEVCDGTDKRGENCKSLGYSGGILRCKADCSDFNTSGCADCDPENKCGTKCCKSSQCCEGDACIICRL